MELDRNICDAVYTVLNAHPEILCCYVFGSAASGKFDLGSDVDVAVACQNPLTSHQKAQLRNELEAALVRDVDLVDLAVATGTILRNALRGYLVLCRSSLLKSRLMRKMIYDQEDLQPLRRMMMDLRRKEFVHGH